MQTVMTTNNAYDTILLVDDNDLVLSAWQADDDTIKSYLTSGDQADEWHTGEWPLGFDPNMQDADKFAAELRTIAAYGTEVGRNGQITNESRREFWSEVK